MTNNRIYALWHWYFELELARDLEGNIDELVTQFATTSDKRLTLLQYSMSLLDVANWVVLILNGNMDDSIILND